MWALNGGCVRYVSNLFNLAVFSLEIRTVCVEYVGKDLSDFKVSLWSTYSSNTESTVWDESVVHRLIQYRNYGLG